MKNVMQLMNILPKGGVLWLEFGDSENTRIDRNIISSVTRRGGKVTTEVCWAVSKVDKKMHKLCRVVLVKKMRKLWQTPADSLGGSSPE